MEVRLEGEEIAVYMGGSKQPSNTVNTDFVEVSGNTTRVFVDFSSGIMFIVSIMRGIEYHACFT